MKATISLILLATLILSANSDPVDRYQEHPDQKIHAHIQDKDYNDLPLTDTWDKSKALFKISQLNETEYYDAWQGASRSFSGDNYYTLHIKGGQSATLAEFAFEVVDMTKLIFNFHCTNPKGSKPMKAEI